jgi:hypothetical protein
LFYGILLIFINIFEVIMLSKRSFLAVILLIGLLLGGCTTPLPPQSQMQRDLENHQLPHKPSATNSVVYVVRPSSLGTAVRFNVFLDDQDPASEMGYNRGGQYIYFSTTPGPHKIFSVAENTPELAFDTKPGEVIYIQQKVYPGVIMARNDLSILPATEGQWRVKTLSLGTIIKTQK